VLLTLPINNPVYDTLTMLQRLALRWAALLIVASVHSGVQHHSTGGHGRVGARSLDHALGRCSSGIYVQLPFPYSRSWCSALGRRRFWRAGR
ncbi:MAG: hypothetical protein WKF82_06070, partial [Nocardioidaceae bacterium]